MDLEDVHDIIAAVEENVVIIMGDRGNHISAFNHFSRKDGRHFGRSDCLLSCLVEQYKAYGCLFYF